MILFIVAVLVFIGSIFVFHHNSIFEKSNSVAIVTLITLLLSGSVLITMASIRVQNNVNQEETIELLEVRRDSIISRYNSIPGDHDTYRKLVIADEISEWNKFVKSEKKASDSILVGWMFNDEVADSLEFIEYGYFGSDGIAR